jgi:hypothetical protein
MALGAPVGYKMNLACAHSVTLTKEGAFCTPAPDTRKGDASCLGMTVREDAPHCYARGLA